MSKTPDPSCIMLPSHAEVSTDKRRYAEAFLTQYEEQDPIRGRRMCQQQDTDRYLIQNEPSLPLSREALDAVYDLPIWEGDKIFFRLMEQQEAVFSLKLRYVGDALVEKALDGRAF